MENKCSDLNLLRNIVTFTVEDKTTTKTQEEKNPNSDFLCLAFCCWLFLAILLHTPPVQCPPQGGHPLVPGWPHLGGLLNSGPRKLLGIPGQGPAMGGQGQGPEQGPKTRNILGVPSFISSLLGVFHKVTNCNVHWSSLLWLYLSAQPTVSPTRKEEEKNKMSYHSLHKYEAQMCQSQFKWVLQSIKKLTNTSCPIHPYHISYWHSGSKNGRGSATVRMQPESRNCSVKPSCFEIIM